MRKNTPRNIVFFANPILARPSTHANVADFFGDSIRRPLWVKSRHRRAFRQCPLYPRKRTFGDALAALDSRPSVCPTCRNGRRRASRQASSSSTLEIIPGLPFHVVPGVVHAGQSGWRRGPVVFSFVK